MIVLSHLVCNNRFCIYFLLVLLLGITSGNSFATSIPCNAANSQTNSVNSGCAGCTITNASKAVDNSTSSYSSIHVNIGQTGYVEQVLIFPNTGSTGDSIVLMLLLGMDVPDTSWLSNVSVATYHGTSFNNDRITLNSPSVYVKLSHNIPNFPPIVPHYALVRFAAGQSFDRVQLRLAPQSHKVTDVNVMYSYNHIPMPTVQSKLIVICQGYPVTVKALSPSGATFNWYQAPTGGSIVFSGSSHTISNVNSAITYYVEATKNGCANPNRVSVKIEISSDPYPPIVEEDYICKGQHAILTAHTPSAAIFWYSHKTGGSYIAQGDSFITPNLNTNTIYYAEAVNRTGCKNFNGRAPVQATILKSSQQIIKWSIGANEAVVACLPTSTGGYLLGLTKADFGLNQIDANGNYIWKKIYGGADNDHMVKLIPGTDDGYILAGNTKSTNGDITDGNNGGDDIWIVKVDSNGNKLWDKTYGGTNDDQLTEIISTADGYLISGVSKSSNGDVSDGNNGGLDYLIIKINKSGVKQWVKTFGGNKDDLIIKSIAAKDGGFLIGGTSSSTNGDISGNHGKKDFWMVKIDHNGNKVWTKSMGGSKDDELKNFFAAADGGFIMGGTTISDNGDITGYHGNGDLWTAKLSSTGHKLWTRSFGGSQDEYQPYLMEATDGGYLLSGITESNDGDIKTPHGFTDICLFKFDSDGNVKWSKGYGGELFDERPLLVSTADGGYLIGGVTRSSTGDVTTIPHGYTDLADLWFVKITVNGTIVWDETLGGSYEEAVISITPTLDGANLICAYASVVDGDVVMSDSIQHPTSWIFKLGDHLPCYMIRDSSVRQSSMDISDDTNLPMNLPISYINPFSARLLLMLDLEKESIVKINLYNEQGVEVGSKNNKMKKGIQKFQLNTKKLRPGKYTCMVYKDGKIYELKLFKVE